MVGRMEWSGKLLHLLPHLFHHPDRMQFYYFVWTCWCSHVQGVGDSIDQYWLVVVFPTSGFGVSSEVVIQR